MDGLMSRHGGFEHNAHSLRIVEELETRYPGFNGLNLTWEVREGIIKHNSEHDRPAMNDDYEMDRPPCLEAQIVDIADEIAYNNHDIDDGLSSEMIDLDSLENVELWREHFNAVKEEYPGMDMKIIKYQTVKRIINAQATDLVETALKAVKKGGVKSIDDVRNSKPIARFSPEMDRKNRQLKKFLLANLYRHHRVERMAYKAERIIRELFKAYLENLRLLPPHLFSHLEKTGKDGHRVICDYIAGMTDRFALDEFKKLFDPYEKV